MRCMYGSGLVFNFPPRLRRALGVVQVWVGLSVFFFFCGSAAEKVKDVRPRYPFEYLVVSHFLLLVHTR